MMAYNVITYVQICLISFHLQGVEALVACGMMESLLKVINWYGDGQEHITVSRFGFYL